MAAVTVRNIDVERLPALIIIMRMRSNTEIFTVVNGKFYSCWYPYKVTVVTLR